jgi:pathogen-inducible salicylic acid glucosyltransferase
MVAVAQWPEQPMNAWYVEAAWCVDVRVRPAAPPSRTTPDVWDY